MPNDLLIETIRKLNAEIDTSNILLFLGIFFLAAFLIAAFLVHTRATHESRKLLREVMLVLALSSIWLVVRQEIIIHSAGWWLRMAEVVSTDIHHDREPTITLLGWEHDRKQLWFRFFMLPLSDVLFASIFLYVICKLYLDEKKKLPFDEASPRIQKYCKLLIVAGIIAAIFTPSLAGK